MSVSPLPFAAPGAVMPWRRCLVLVLALHLLVVALFWPWRDKAAPAWVPPPAIMVVMAAAPQAPAEVKQPPGQRTPPPQVEPPAPPEPLPTVKVPEAVRPNIAVPPKQKKPPKPVKTPPCRAHRRRRKRSRRRRFRSKASVRHRRAGRIKRPRRKLA